MRYVILSCLLIALVSGCRVDTKYNSIYEAIEADDLNDVKAHLRKGVPIETKLTGCTPLSAAVMQHRIAVAEFLLLEGANPNVVTRSQESLIMWSVEHHDTAAVDLLLRNGADRSGIVEGIGQRGMIGPFGAAVLRSDTFFANRIFVSESPRLRKLLIDKPTVDLVRGNGNFGMLGYLASLGADTSTSH
jgi:ankyrin repeat protein